MLAFTVRAFDRSSSLQALRSDAVETLPMTAQLYWLNQGQILPEMTWNHNNSPPFPPLIVTYDQLRRHLRRRTRPVLGLHIEVILSSSGSLGEIWVRSFVFILTKLVISRKFGHFIS